MSDKEKIVDILKDIGIISRVKHTRAYPYWGDRFTAYKRGTSSDYQRARTFYIRKYGLKSWENDIKPIIKSDRLKIFTMKPSQKRVFFINRLAWSSEERIRKSGKLGKIIQSGLK